MKKIFAAVIATVFCLFVRWEVKQYERHASSAPSVTGSSGAGVALSPA